MRIDSWKHPDDSFSCIRRRFSLMIDRALLNGALLVESYPNAAEFTLSSSCRESIPLSTWFPRIKMTASFFACNMLMQSLPWGTMHLEGDQSSERFASQCLQASRIVVTNTTRLLSSAQRATACLLFVSYVRSLPMKKPKESRFILTCAFRAVWLMQIKGHAKLLWTLIMSNPSSSLMKMARTCSVLPLVLIFCQVTHFRIITCSLRGLEEGDLTSFIWICISFVHLPSGIWSDGKNESANRLISFWVCRC